MNCPVYVCTLPPASTTTPATTTTGSPRPGPTPPSSPITPGMYGSSVAVNLIFGAALVTLIIKLWKRPAPRTPIIRPQSTGFRNPLFRDPEENDPLLARLGFRPRREPDYGLQGFDAAQQRLASTPATLELQPSAPPPAYPGTLEVEVEHSGPPPAYAASIFETDVELGDDLELGPSRSGTTSPTSEQPRENPFEGLVSAFDRLFKRKKTERQNRDPLSDSPDSIDGIASADL